MTSVSGNRPSDLIAFMDESRKPVRDPATGRVIDGQHQYAVVAAAVMVHDLAATRNALRVVASGHNDGRHLHWSSAGTERRQRFIDAIVEVPDWEAYVFETAHSISERHCKEAKVRSNLLRVAFPYLSSERGVSHITLETRSKPSAGFVALDRTDHRDLQAVNSKGLTPNGLSISHEGKSEPMLWLADVIAGARTDWICAVNRSYFSRVAYRVDITKVQVP